MGECHRSIGPRRAHGRACGDARGCSRSKTPRHHAQRTTHGLSPCRSSGEGTRDQARAVDLTGRASPRQRVEGSGARPPARPRSAQARHGQAGRNSGSARSNRSRARRRGDAARRPLRDPDPLDRALARGRHRARRVRDAQHRVCRAARDHRARQRAPRRGVRRTARSAARAPGSDRSAAPASRGHRRRVGDVHRVRRPVRAGAVCGGGQRVCAGDRRASQNTRGTTSVVVGGGAQHAAPLLFRPRDPVRPGYAPRRVHHPGLRSKHRRQDRAHQGRRFVGAARAKRHRPADRAAFVAAGLHRSVRRYRGPPVDRREPVDFFGARRRAARDSRSRRLGLARLARRDRQRHRSR